MIDEFALTGHEMRLMSLQNQINVKYILKEIRTPDTYVTRAGH
jgi:hypothetical protein